MPDSGVVGPYAEWYWLKLASPPSSSSPPAVGPPIFDLDSDSPRRCYEGLVIGRYQPTPIPEAGKDEKGGKAGTEEMKEVPELEMFASVPMGHSRKPDILGALLSWPLKSPLS